MEDINEITTHIKTKDGIIITTERILDGDLCPHNKYVSVRECPEGCEYYVNGKLRKYYLEINLKNTGEAVMEFEKNHIQRLHSLVNILQDMILSGLKK